LQELKAFEQHDLVENVALVAVQDKGLLRYRVTQQCSK
jgi:hypothetical protein